MRYSRLERRVQHAQYRQTLARIAIVCRIEVSFSSSMHDDDCLLAVSTIEIIETRVTPETGMTQEIPRATPSTRALPIAKS